MKRPSLRADHPAWAPEWPRRAAFPEKTEAGKRAGGADGRFGTDCERPAVGKHPAKRACTLCGFTLLEIILTLLILAIAVAPMMNAFAPALLVTGQEEEAVVLTGQARRTLNRLVDLPFKTLDDNRGNPANLAALFGSQAEANRENFVYLNTNYTPVVAIADASGGAGGLLGLTVTLKGISLQSQKANY